MSPPSVTFSGKTKYFGLLADPVEHVRAPTIFLEKFETLGLDAAYIPLQVSAEHFAAVTMALRDLKNFHGYGVTMPHKETAATICDELLPNAKACGVVNNIRVESDGRWVGESLDGVGMVRGIQAERPIDKNTSVLVVGAGGTGRQIAVALALAGAGRIALANRTVAKAEKLAATVRSVAPSSDVDYAAAFDPEAFDIVINATSLGLKSGDPLPVDPSRLSDHAVVAEVVMNPANTPLLERARERGLTTVPGRAMMDHQLELIIEEASPFRSGAARC